MVGNSPDCSGKPTADEVFFTTDLARTWNGKPVEVFVDAEGNRAPQNESYGQKIQKKIRSTFRLT